MTSNSDQHFPHKWPIQQSWWDQWIISTQEKFPGLDLRVFAGPNSCGEALAETTERGRLEALNFIGSLEWLCYWILPRNGKLKFSHATYRELFKGIRC
jgi:hypothetical protein